MVWAFGRTPKSLVLLSFLNDGGTETIQSTDWFEKNREGLEAVKVGRIDHSRAFARDAVAEGDHPAGPREQLRRERLRGLAVHGDADVPKQFRRAGMN